MSYVICCDYDDCGKTTDLGFSSKIPKAWEVDHGRHFCSIRCLREHGKLNAEPTSIEDDDRN